MADHEIIPQVLNDIQRNYGVGIEYATAYLSYWQRVNDRTEQSLSGILASPGARPMWFDYAMSTNQRARNFFEQHRPDIGDRRGRYLDVGCGFGGFLVVFAEQGFEVRGIELDPERVAFSRANCLDVGLRDVVEERNILNPNIALHLGGFDVITCLDVIEHVLDVEKTLEHLARLLNPGGVLILEIPNMDSIAFVQSDGHFKLFGITQLDRAESIDYHKRFFGFEYDVGYYHPLDFYTSQLAAHGLSSEAFASPLHPAAQGGLIEWVRLWRLCRGWLAFHRGHALYLPAELRRLVDRRVLRFCASVVWNSFAAHIRLQPRQRFERRFLCDFWAVVARAPEESQSSRATR